MPSPLADYLMEDHARLDALLRTALDGEPFNQDAFEQFRAGLLRHIGIEEKLLLPAARRRRGGDPLPLAAILRVEHAALASLMVPTPDRALAQEIASLLVQHNAREEGPDGIYEQVAALAAEEGETLLDKARATRPPPLAAHFDGSGVYRTAAAALAAAALAASRAKERR